MVRYGSGTVSGNGTQIVPDFDSAQAGWQQHWPAEMPRYAFTVLVLPGICSAGYGLIPMDAEVRLYAATFSPGASRFDCTRYSQYLGYRVCEVQMGRIRWAAIVRLRHFPFC
jgi:hypothetical protein